MAEVQKDAVEYFNWMMLPNLQLNEEKVKINKQLNKAATFAPGNEGLGTKLYKKLQDIADVENGIKKYSEVFTGFLPDTEYWFIAPKDSYWLTPGHAYVWSYSAKDGVIVRDITTGERPKTFTAYVTNEDLGKLNPSKVVQDNIAAFTDMVKDFTDNFFKGQSMINQRKNINRWRKIQNKIIPGEWLLTADEIMERDLKSKLKRF